MVNKKVLIHCCCAHCAAYTINHFKELGYDVTAYWYNPNIHPYTEHESRLNSMRELAEKLGVPLVAEEGYDMPEFLREVALDLDNRCSYCFNIRLEKCASFAVKHGFKGFTSTLLISPHQKHELLKEIGARLAGSKGVEFFYEDMRKRYSDSRCITKPMDLYRQTYCGCIYSEWERYKD